MKELQEYCAEAYKIAAAHGFHDEIHLNEHLLCLIISELMEAVEADRKNRHANLVDFEDLLEKYNDFDRAFETDIKDTVEDELADACIRAFDLCGARGITLNTSYKLEFVDCGSFAANMYRIIRIIYEYKNLHVSMSLLIAVLTQFADRVGFDLFKHIELKMQYNRQRPRLHGKAY